MDKEEFFHQKRSILFTTRIRFSPEVQPVKQTAIDKILEQNLLFFDTSMTVDELRREGVVCFKYDFDIINRQEMEESLGRLVSGRRVDIEKRDGEKLYKLAEDARKELEKEQENADIHFKKVVNKIFKNACDDPLIFSPPFLKCLSIIFSELAERYVKVLKGEVSEEKEFVGASALYSAIERIEEEFCDVIKGSTFRDGVIDFFRFADPDYDIIKWNMAQNYYIAKVLGMDPDAILLSREIFGGGIFYLDTNVIISALEPKHVHHSSFKELSVACKKLDIKLNVCQITLDELHNVLVYQRDLLEKVVDRIPEETKQKVRGIFYESYTEKQLSNGEVDFDSLFSSFDDPMKKLRESFGVELVDDKWFIGAENEEATLDLMDVLRKKYINMRGRPKAKPIALHDALLLLWLKKTREVGEPNAWLITLDTSLPGSLARPERQKDRPYAITLDALLQWISPIAVTYETEVDFATVFSEAVKYQLLPRDRFFDIKDFLVFDELQIESQELPAEDVEQAIKHIRTQAPGLDPSDPSDREKLARELKKFFIDPGRKYKQEVSRLESEVSRLESKLTGIDQVLKQRDEEIKQYEARIEEESLKRSAQTRLGFTLLIFIILEGLVVLLANKYGEGANLFQKILSSWQLFGIGVAIAMMMGWFLIGRERLKALGWPFTKIFKHE